MQDDVNRMATILTYQIRRIALTTAALAQGTGTPRLAPDARGEMRGVQLAINEIVERVNPPILLGCTGSTVASSEIRAAVRLRA